MRSLIVDDNKENCYLLEVLLKGNGYEVVSAANGADALDKLRSQKFDLVISDIMMPVMDGFQLCRLCKQDAALKGIPFVFYTATYTDVKDEELALKLGADCFIRKPAEPDEFIRQIGAALKKSGERKSAVEKPLEVAENEVLKLYNERLVNKLEQKIVQLEEANAEVKKAEQALREVYEKEKQQRQELQEEARTRGMFIDVLAHELRTPLTPVMASGDVLYEMLSSHPDGIAVRLSANICTGAKVLSNRLEELLELAMFSRGTFKLKKGPVDLAEFFHQIVADFKPSIDQREQTFHVEIADGLPVAEIDAPRIRQVVNNLLSNANKFSPQNGHVSFKSAVLGNELSVEVGDNGIGVSPEESARIFQPYHRVEQDRLKFPGLGLGLAVSKQIVEAHGGRIWVVSSPGLGSAFHFTLPVTSSPKH